MFGPILFSLSTAQDGSGSGIAIDNVQLGDDMLLQLKKVETSFFSSSYFDDNVVSLKNASFSFLSDFYHEMTRYWTKACKALV